MQWAPPSGGRRGHFEYPRRQSDRGFFVFATFPFPAILVAFGLALPACRWPVFM